MLRHLFILFLTLGINLSADPLRVKVSAKSAILINGESGAILYEKNAHDRANPASLTKIATCLYAVKKYKSDLDDLVSAPHHCLRKMNKSVKVAHNYRDPAYLLEPDASHFWIKRGEELSFRDLLYGMMLASGGDAANYVAHHVGGTIFRFMKGMNSYLKEIGCEESNFSNPHGLHHPRHFSTAYDLSLIAKESLKSELINTIVSTREYERKETNLQGAKRVVNRNLLLQSGKFFYPRAVGMKTGYTSDAGYNIASVARDGERTLIAILLGGRDASSRYRDTIRLFEAAFSEKKVERLLFKKDENSFSRLISKGRDHLRATLAEDVTISYYPAEEPEITIELNWEYQTPPIMRGSYVGAIKILNLKGEVIESSPLIATQDVERSYPALLGDALRGDLECPADLQSLLLFLLALGVVLSLYGIYRTV
ncbi:MAG: D-alanyl-D-alanine carboxypeptidase DacF [Chlamydiae bacterium]|nr:D-alanyl-D-alanine carboxypeptidase DacF [Chlamydiota bacterium]